MSTIEKNPDTGAYDIDVKLDWSDLMLIQQSLKIVVGDGILKNQEVRTQRRIDMKLNELNKELGKV